jgi:hypothetical protein
MVICLSGWKQSGKDSLASYLVENHDAARVALADPLKDSVSREFNIPRWHLDDPKFKESPILSMPVDPKDGFSRMIALFMRGEFRNAQGTSEGGDSLNGLYWTPRSLAILKGSTNRSVQSNYWTNKAFDQIDRLLKNTKLVVVTDLRYKSEMAQFKERYGQEVVFIRINRFKESPSQDPSERDLDQAEFDFYVDNAGTLEEAYGRIREILGL